MTGRSIKTLTLKAAPGIRYPIMGRPHKHITEHHPHEVESHAYYHKAILDGDLIEVDLAPAVTVTGNLTSTANFTNATSPTK